MAKREPKTKHTTTIEVIGRPGDKKGRIELGTGSIVYYRPAAKQPTLQLTYQQLISLLEKDVEYSETDEKVFKIPRPHADGDFILSVFEVEDDEPQFALVESTSSIKKLDQRRIDSGHYQFSQDMQNGKKPKKYTWFAQLSVQAALWVVHRYIEKFLVSRRAANYTDANVQISKLEMRNLLLRLHKRIS